MKKIVGIAVSVDVEVKDGMTDDEVEDLAIQTMCDYNKGNNRYLVKINGAEIIDFDDF